MTTHATVDPAAYDYHHRDGMPLRPAPRRDEATWIELRRNLYGAWMRVGDGWDDTPQTRLLDDHMWEGDELMDDVVLMFQRVGPPRGRAMFDRALVEGIDAVADAPDELVALFAHLDRVPDWYDAEAGERGRRRLAAATVSGKLAAKAFGVFATAREEDVSQATGSTGRLVRYPVRRSVESQKFFEEVTYRGALCRGSEIFHMVIRVRLMHSLVRRGLRRKWGDEWFAEHGMPISNTSMAAGSGWFASMPVLVDAMLGRPISPRDLDDVAVHWGYILYLFGVNERIIPTNGPDSIRLANHLFASAGQPSKWTDELSQALLAPIEDFFGKAGPALMRVFLAAGASILGTDEVRKLVTGTTYEPVRFERWVPLFLLTGRLLAVAARVGDHLPPVRALRARRSRVGDPLEIGQSGAIYEWGRKNGVDSSPFTHHDDNISGHSFAK